LEAGEQDDSRSKKETGLRGTVDSSKQITVLNREPDHRDKGGASRKKKKERTNPWPEDQKKLGGKGREAKKTRLTAILVGREERGWGKEVKKKRGRSDIHKERKEWAQNKAGEAEQDTSNFVCLGKNKRRKGKRGSSSPTRVPGKWAWEPILQKRHGLMRRIRKTPTEK